MNSANIHAARAAIKGVPYSWDDRQVTVNGSFAEVYLHGQNVATYNYKHKILQLYGSSPPTKKTCRLMNVLLRETGFTGRIHTYDTADWFYTRSKKSKRQKFTHECMTFDKEQS